MLGYVERTKHVNLFNKFGVLIACSVVNTVGLFVNLSGIIVHRAEKVQEVFGQISTRQNFIN
jgi:hypothetical protein